MMIYENLFIRLKTTTIETENKVHLFVDIFVLFYTNLNLNLNLNKLNFK